MFVSIMITISLPVNTFFTDTQDIVPRVNKDL